jgi:peroxin-13
MYGNRMGMGYGASYGQNPMDMEPSFSQMADESAASAFQSIESFVSAFGSISAMLDSTFHALYSSFRAVVGVADQLGRVKQILSALAVFRFFKWVYRRILYLVGKADLLLRLTIPNQTRLVLKMHLFFCHNRYFEDKAC